MPLPQLRIVRVSGADAGSFLDAQLSCSVSTLTAEQSALSAWHDAKGKTRAIFRVVRDGDDYLLCVAADLAEATVRALRMFVLRAAVRIEASDLQCLAQMGTAAGNTLQPGAVARDAAGIECAITDTLSVLITTAQTDEADAAAALAFDAAEIQCGLPQLDTRTTQRYVAHMLNLDKLGAVDFTKGCYPGQEVIARTEHLGSVKRRARSYRTTCPSLPASETDVVDAQGAAVGSVLRSGRSADGTAWIMAIVNLERAAEIQQTSEALFLDDESRSVLEPVALPFD